MNSIFRTIADTLALTSAERRVVQFLLVGCILGIGVRVVRDLVASPTKFDYSGTDSAFVALSSLSYAQVSVHASEPDRSEAIQDDMTKGPVRINSATKAQLMVLPGVGEVTAERIILERQDHGPFITVEDLGRVRGIGARRIEQLKPLVIID